MRLASCAPGCTTRTGSPQCSCTSRNTKCDIERNDSGGEVFRLFTRYQLSHFTLALIKIIDVGDRLPAGRADNQAASIVLNRPGRRKASIHLLSQWLRAPK